SPTGWRALSFHGLKLLKTNGLPAQNLERGRGQGGVFNELDSGTRLAQVGKELGLLFGHELGEGGGDPHANRLAGSVQGEVAREGAPQLQRDGQIRLDPAAASAVRTGAGQGSLEIAPGSLTRDLDQSEVRDLQDARTRAIAGELLLEAFEDLPAVLEVLHVD